MYENRNAAGRILGDRLVEYGIRPDVVLAVPSGGVEVARPICERFDAKLGLLAVEPVRAPVSHDLPIGAVTDTGETWIDRDLVETFDVDDEQLRAEKQRAFRDARDKHEFYDEVGEDPTPVGTVTIVDEGVVSGTTMKACLSAIDEVNDAYSVAAAPVGPPDTVAELHAHADEVGVTETPPNFQVLREFYDEYERLGASP